MVTSAQFDHTWLVESQSYRKPTTYLPGLTFGTRTTSSTEGCSRMHASLQGSGNPERPHGWMGGLSQREQSLPAVSGQGSQWPDEQLPGDMHESTCSPILQPQLKSPGW